MKNRSYSVEISLDGEDGIVVAKCSCPRGQLICHHMAAVCIFGHHNISVTDQACLWNAPKKSKSEESLTINEMYPRKKEYVAVGRQSTDGEVKDFLGKLSEPVGFTWLLKPEPSNECIQLIPSIENIIFCKEFLDAENKEVYIKRRCLISQDTILRKAAATSGQHKNENWLLCRKLRLTASHFGMVLAAYRRNRYPPSLFKSLLEGYDLDHVQWGRVNEIEAINMLSSGMNIKIESTGLWLDECGFLGASPDGLVGTDALVEVKCPYKYRSSSLSEVLKNDKTYIIYKNENNKTVINKTHPYWDQIQGQLYITKRQTCYLVVWTPSECEVVLIDKDQEWAKNLDILKTFYVENYVKSLLDN